MLADHALGPSLLLTPGTGVLVLVVRPPVAVILRAGRLLSQRRAR